MRGIRKLQLVLSLILQAGLVSCWSNECADNKAHLHIDMSNARIVKSSTYEYELSFFDTPVRVQKSANQVSLVGNFSKLVMKNSHLNQFQFLGTQMVFQIPVFHIFSRSKLPDMEIQVIYRPLSESKQFPNKYIVLSQLYAVSRHSKRVTTTISSHFNSATKDGDVVETGELIKIVQGFPILMYKGTLDASPCRTDVLCLIKREYQLIAAEDLEQVKSALQVKQDISFEVQSLQKEKIYQIKSIRRDIQQQQL